MQTNHLLDTLYTVDPKTTGILFSSWFYKHTFAGNTSLVTNSHLLVSTTSAPLFSLGMMTIKDNAGGIIGGYIYDQHAYSQKIIQTIQSILNGKQASEIPFTSLQMPLRLSTTMFCYVKECRHTYVPRALFSLTSRLRFGNSTDTLF